MKRKKKSKKRIQPSHVLTDQEERLLITLLSDFKDSDPAEIVGRIPNARLAEIFVERLPAFGAPSVSLLQALGERFTEKPVLKAIKRAAFKLKQRGLLSGELSLEKKSSKNILKPPSKEKPVAAVGPVLDMVGSRAILILMEGDRKGWKMGTGVISDERGFQEFYFGTLSKRRIKEIKDSLSEEAGPLVEISLSHAATLLENSYHRHMKLHSNGPEQYLELRPLLLADRSLLDRPAIYDFLPEITVPDGVLTDSQLAELFKHKLMESWFIEPEPLRPFVEDILKLDDSPIVLTEAQKSDRARQVKEGALQTLFDDEKRILLKYRFEEMSFFFFKLGEKHPARLSLLAAGRLDEKDSTLKTNPVVEFLLDRSIDFYMNIIKEESDDEGRKKDSSSGIILP